MSAVALPLTCALCWLGLLSQLRDLWAAAAGRRFGTVADPARRALCLALAGLAVACTVTWQAAAVDRYSHVPNLGRLLANCAAMVGAYGGHAALVQLTSTDVAGRRVGRCTGLLLAGLVCAATLFALTPPDPVTSAASPRYFGEARVYVSPYVYVYLAYLAATLPQIGLRSRRYAALTDLPVLRVGLRVVSVASVCGVAYCLVKAALLTAAAVGLDVHGWEGRTATPLYVCTVLLFVAGLVLPAAGVRALTVLRWLRAYRAHRRLRPLWRAVSAAVPDVVLVPSRRLDRFDPRDLRFRLYRRVIEILDGGLALRGYVHPRAVAVARGLADRAGLRGDAAEAVVQAACLATAVDARRRGLPPLDAALSAPVSGHRDGSDLAAEVAWLERVALAFSSPVTGAVVRTVRANGTSPRSGPAEPECTPRPPHT